MSEDLSLARVVVAGAGTGAGKTTVAVGLAAALRRRGHTVQTFKVGLDTHDASYLAHVTGRPCRNLDPWIMGAGGVRRSVVRGAAGADLVVIEGALGLYDSHGRRSVGGYPFPGSTAEVAAIAGAPVLVVLDAATGGETVAATALGLHALDRSLHLVGVVLNGAPSEAHRTRVEDAIWEHARLPVLGSLPLVDAMRIPEWSHGLVPVAANPAVDAAIDHLAAAVERCCDVDLLVRLMRGAAAISGVDPEPLGRAAGNGPRLRLGVAFDEAFCSYYPENLERLADAGADIVPFSPLEEDALPPGLEGLYVGGGCLEAYSERLARNRSLAASLLRARGQGLPVYVEGGGVLWAARRLRLPDGSSHEMAGLLPVDVEVDGDPPPSAHRELRLEGDCLLGPAGTTLRGHEYHARAGVAGGRLEPLYAMHDCDGEPLGCDGWQAPGLAASLVQLHFGQGPDLAAALVEGMRAARPSSVRA